MIFLLILTIYVYSEPAETIVAEALYSAPCNATSCRKNEVCLINRNQCAENGNCSKHQCVPGFRIKKNFFICKQFLQLIYFHVVCNFASCVDEIIH